jgi:hypothetical protein
VTSVKSECLPNNRDNKTHEHEENIRRWGKFFWSTSVRTSSTRNAVPMNWSTAQHLFSLVAQLAADRECEIQITSPFVENATFTAQFPDTVMPVVKDHVPELSAEFPMLCSWLLILTSSGVIPKR